MSATITLQQSNPVLAMFASADVLVEPGKKDWLLSCIAGLSAHENINDMLAEGSTYAAADDGFWPEPDSWRAAVRPYVIRDGILHIPVKGMLLNQFPFQYGNWATGYEYIWRAFQRGCDDYKAGNIKGIALVVNSGGGLVAGCWDLVDKMEALKAETGVPVRAFAHESAYSAAYGVSCVADEIVVSRTGGVGSIGTLRTHVDWSKFNERMGLAYTFIQAGECKTDGHPDKPLSERAKSRWMKQVNELNEIFVAAVSRNRGLDEQAIRDMEAATFSATEALSNGLADQIGPLDDALAAYAADLSSNEGDEQMSTQDTAAETQAAIDAAVAQANAKAAETQAAAVAAAVAAEKQRVAGITALEEAKGREALANHIAMNTSMSVEDAKAMLAAAPAAAAATETPTEPATDPLNTAMDQTGGGAGVAPDGGKSDTEAKEDGSEDLALAAAVGLKGFAKTAGQ